MKNTLNLSRNSEVLLTLSALPEKILRLHGTDNTSEFVLYELCQEHCFNLPKAAFFVDNPDFNCFKGVAGFNKEEHPENFSLWDDPESFTHFMSQNSFNKQVRSINQCTKQNTQEEKEKLFTDIAHQLDVRDLGFHRFPLRHGNHGFILYDKHESDMADLDIFSRGACLLGFCPVF
ncbi:MAG: hypothetical protein K2X90_00415 [Candidatus Babeliaceae bacterium]|nr:hypothetical protein [Candidatus Babeliaceae bacterium]